MTTFNTIYNNINGVIDTTQTAWTNIENLSVALGVWFTFDIHTGNWAVIINRAGSSTASFNDSNILGAINVTGTGVYELYNSVKVSFPNKLLGDEKDYVVLQIPNNQLFANEPLNTLDISTDLINDQIQAQMLGLRELKQSRVDKIIEFRTDYSFLELKAGDIIDITSSMYGFTNKFFRIVSIQEEDDEEGNIVLSITALEYDANVYNYSDINYYLRNKNNGLRPTTNTAVTASQNGAVGAQVVDAINNPVYKPSIVTGLVTGGGLLSMVAAFQGPVISHPGNDQYLYTTIGTLTLPYTGNYKVRYFINWGGSGSPGPDGVIKNSEMRLFLNNVQQNIGLASFTGDLNVQLYEDHFLEGFVYGTAGQVLRYEYGGKTNWPTAIYVVIGDIVYVPVNPS